MVSKTIEIQRVEAQIAETNVVSLPLRIKLTLSCPKIFGFIGKPAGKKSTNLPQTHVCTNATAKTHLFFKVHTLVISSIFS